MDFYPAGATIRHRFFCRGEDNAPIALASEAVAAYRDGGTTAVTTGITLAVWNSITGAYLLTIVTTDVAWLEGEWVVSFTAGTIDSIALTGQPVLAFRLGYPQVDTVEIGGAAPVIPTVAQIRTEMDDNSTQLAAIVAAVGVVDGIADNILVDTGTTLAAAIAALPTVAEVAAAGGLKLGDAVPDPGTADTVGRALRRVLANVDAPISGVGGATGSGSVSHTVTVTQGGNPVDGMALWVTADSAGATVVAGTLYSNTLGQATFLLDAGTYYLWGQLGGFEPIMGAAMVVTT